MPIRLPPRIWSTLLALSVLCACSGDPASSLSGTEDGVTSDAGSETSDLGGGSSGTDAGGPFVCPADCSGCTGDERGACEDAAGQCTDPVCCLQVVVELTCDPNAPEQCAFDCGACVDPTEQEACAEASALCSGLADTARPACCGFVEQTFAGCEEAAPSVCPDIDCGTCATASETNACVVAVRACENAPAGTAACCNLVADTFPSCVPGSDLGACGIDCETCSGASRAVCSVGQGVCGGRELPERIGCCALLRDQLGMNCEL